MAQRNTDSNDIPERRFQDDLRKSSIPRDHGRSPLTIWFSTFSVIVLMIIPVMILQGNACGSQGEAPVSLDPSTSGSGQVDLGRSLDVNGPTGVFIENRGQFPPSMDFVSETPFGRIGLGDGSIYYHVREGPVEPMTDRSYVIRLDMVGANEVDPVGLSPAPTSYNYFLGNDPSEWITGAQGYSSVIYRDVWDNIDMVFRSREGKMKYDLILAPGADHSEIRFRVEGIEQLKVHDGSLAMVLSDGLSLIDSSLMAYQDDHGSSLVDVSFNVEGSDYGFHLGKYDHGKPVIIDPQVDAKALNFSTYVGGSGFDEPTGMDLGPKGDVFVCGYTHGNDFPTTPGAYQTNKSKEWMAAFVFKLASDGSNLTYCTYLGGSNGSFASDISVTPSGTAIVCGYTDSNDFPLTVGAYDRSISGVYDCFVLELGATGSTISYSTFFGGAGTEGAPEMDVDADGLVYAVTTTNSTDLPTTSNAYQRTLTKNAVSGTCDLAMFVLDLKKMSLRYSTYLGGTDWEIPSDLKCGPHSIVYVGGYTCSQDLPTTAGSYMTTIGGDYDGFLFAMNTSKGSMVYSTYFGGSMFDGIFGIDIDPSGRMFACGRTYSSDLPITSMAFDKKYNGNCDAFIIGLNGTGGSLAYSTYVGGSGFDSFVSMVIDAVGDVQITGETRSSDYPVVPQVLQTAFAGGQDAIYTKFALNFSAMLYSTYLGGSGYENMLVMGQVSVDDESGEPVIFGGTSSSDFPTTSGSFDTSYDIVNSNGDVFVTKIHVQLPPGMPFIRSVESGDSFVNISWDPPVNNFSLPVREFEVLRGHIRGRLDPIGSSGLNRSFNDTAVKNGFLYYYAVRGVNELGTGPMSIEVPARPGARPSAPLNLSAIYGNSKVSLQWDAPCNDGGFDIISYGILRTWETDGFVKTGSFNSTLEHYEDEDVTNGIEYSYSVIAVNELGRSFPSLTISSIPRTVPGAPSSLIAISGPDHSLLIWEAPGSDGGANIIGYNIYRTFEDGWGLIGSVYDDAGEYNDTGLNVGRLYRYRVTAFNSEGESEPSEEAEAFPRDHPSSPVNFTATASDRSVLLRWDPPLTNGGSSLLGYRIYRTEGSNATTQTQSISQTYFTDRVVVNGRSYVYSVSAYNRLGESPLSDRIFATPIGRPSAPSELRGSAEDGSVHLSWDIPYNGGSPITSFIVHREDTGSGMVHHANTTGPAFDDRNLRNGVTYRYVVQSVNAIGISDHSEGISLTPIGLPDPPNSLNISTSDGRIKIFWINPADDGGSPIDNFWIYRGIDDGELSFLAGTVAYTNEYTDEILENGIVYHYAVSSVNALGEGALSEIVSGIPSTVPGAPASLEAYMKNGSVVLEWSGPKEEGGSPITGYRIFRSSEGGQSMPITDLGPDTIYFVDEDVSEGSSYEYVVKASNTNGMGPASAAVRITVDHLPDGGDDGDPIPDTIVGASGWLACYIVSGILVSLLIGGILFFISKRRRRNADQIATDIDPTSPSHN